MSSTSSSDESTSSSADNEDVLTANNNYFPYQHDPLAVPEEVGVGAGVDGTVDEDGISTATLESRFERNTPLNQWCLCGHCSLDVLEGSLEYRCCHEVQPAMGKLMFDGSIEHINCITLHEDYNALTNTAVLRQVGPLLRNQNGRSYRRRAEQSENEHLRAVAYRWIVRWMCGYLGWENTRPLSACIYNHIRTKFPSRQAHGYAPALDRA